ncbi:AAEL000841-PC [Aedes aegypti]|uniref:AAEL000841-PA n=1 Tax=Aedes aegypti TaxID=7159 RepID=A6KV00_AEDAE|nr:AAEL000841-PB [Aedes aegypti]EAT48115.1 AAEL000841-PA [Aedes aegypti]EAT48116.1 AAEL000841-PC [Aedes aegypti]
MKRFSGGRNTKYKVQKNELKSVWCRRRSQKLKPSCGVRMTRRSAVNARKDNGIFCESVRKLRDEANEKKRSQHQ